MIRFLILSIMTVGLFVCNLIFGAIHIDASDVMSILGGSSVGNEAIEFIVLDSRLPQAVTALFAGAGLAAAGLMLQTAFRNPLAGPSILGITSGASLGVALVMLLLGGTVSIGSVTLGGYAAVIGAAMAGSFLIMALLIFFSAKIRNNLMLLITGIMVGYLTSSLVTLLSSISTEQGVHSYVMWGMGTFGGVISSQLPWFAGIASIGLLISLLLCKPLNILLLGDNYAANLGIKVKRVRTWLLVATGLLSAVITAYCGPIGFIGLAVPHIARLIFRTDNHWVLMPATMIAGADVALACNVLSVAIADSVIPINALTPLVGVPVILYVILSRRKGV